MAMNRAMGATGAWTIDMARFSREHAAAAHLPRRAPTTRDGSSGCEQMLLERGLVDADEIAAGHALRPGKPLARGPFTADDVPRVLTRGSFGRPAPAPARFAVGDRVRARNIHPPTHTRLPRYVRGHAGIVERVHGCHVFPDSAALGRGEDPQWLYTVVLRGPRAVGRGRRSDAHGLDRGVRALSGSGVT